MHYFGMKCVSDKPQQYFPLTITSSRSNWPILMEKVAIIIHGYVLVDQLQELQNETELSFAGNNTEVNPHISRIEEHCYATPYHPHLFRIQRKHNYLRSQPPKKKRILPSWLEATKRLQSPSVTVRRTAPDGILEYSCAVLNDGLFLFELWDAIHEGDGERVARCWKVMLMYFMYGGQLKYALEAVHLQSFGSQMMSD